MAETTLDSFYQLTPDRIMAAVESVGLSPNYSVIPLNSLENRVYLVELSSAQIDASEYFYRVSPTHVVIKFYRPHRWTTEQIKEELFFARELQEAEIPVVAPLEFKGKVLHQDETSGLFFTIFPKAQGRLKDEYTKSEAQYMGRLIARLHNWGALGSFKHRATLNLQERLNEAFSIIDKFPDRPKPLSDYYLTTVKQLVNLAQSTPLPSEKIRLHGDFHRGNILWDEDRAVIIDLDDSVNGPRDFDLWLMIGGNDEYTINLRAEFLEAYSTMTGGEIPSLIRSELYRQVRIVCYTAWVLNRWSDPTFQRMFPHFMTESFWQTQYLDLKEFLGSWHQN